MLAGAGCDTAATMPAPEGHGSRRWGARDPAQWPILRKSDCRPPPSSGSRFISAKHCRAAWSPSRRQHLQSSLCLSRTQSLKLSLDGLLLSLGTLLPSDLSTEVGGSSAEDDRARDAIRTCHVSFFITRRCGARDRMHSQPTPPLARVMIFLLITIAAHRDDCGRGRVRAQIAHRFLITSALVIMLELQVAGCGQT